jgi:CheY-like chemotaxis protein
MSDRPVISVMVVDDTLANRWVLVRVLEEDGYRIIEGETAADAERLAAQRPDLMVLDVRLPDGSGFELARKFKAEERTANIPLLLISASFTSPSERARGLDAGADGYLTHPVEPPVLLATVRALLRSREAEAALRESEARFRSMADSAPVMIWVTDENGKPEWFNRSWLEFTGSTLEQQVEEGSARIRSSRRPGPPRCRVQDTRRQPEAVSRRVQDAPARRLVPMAAQLGLAAHVRDRRSRRLHRLLHRHYRPQGSRGGA